MMILTGYIFLNNNATKFCTTTYGACVVGALCATQFYGDGSNLCNINAGFDPDSRENLYAGTNSGNNGSGSACFNVELGFCAGASLSSGEHNIFIGSCAARFGGSGTANIFLGKYAGGGSSSLAGGCNFIAGFAAGQTISTGENNVLIGTRKRISS